METKIKRTWTDAAATIRCQATITLKDRTTAQCGRSANANGKLCKQHSKLAARDIGEFLRGGYQYAFRVLSEIERYFRLPLFFGEVQIAPGIQDVPALAEILRSKGYLKSEYRKEF